MPQLYAHQRAAWDAARARRARARHDGHRVREDARVQPAGARRARPRPEAAARSTSTRRRRSRRTSSARSPRSGVPGLRARDLRRRHADRAAPADPQVGERRSSRTPTWSTSACCRTTTAGATCSRTSATSSSTRRTSTAASSARTSRTSCAGCGGSRGIYGAEPQFLLASATISNPGELGLRPARRAGDGDRRRRRAARRAHDRPLEPAAARRRARPARLGARRGGEAAGGVRRAAACAR